MTDNVMGIFRVFRVFFWVKQSMPWEDPDNIVEGPLKVAALSWAIGPTFQNIFRNGGGFSNLFLFSSRKLGKIIPFWLAHIFQRGWFNHQLVMERWMIWKNFPRLFWAEVADLQKAPNPSCCHDCFFVTRLMLYCFSKSKYDWFSTKAWSI